MSENNRRPWHAQYDPGVPDRIAVPEISLVDLFDSAVSDFTEKVCTIAGDETRTYGEVDALSDRVAGWLVEQGLEKGDRVGLMLLNSSAFVISYYGILKAGGVVMALNPAYRPAEVFKLVEESGIRFLILGQTNYAAVKSIQGPTALESLLVVGADASALSESDQAWDGLPENPDKNWAAERPGPEDPAVFQYSGGTTGTPKCAIGLHRNLVANVIQFQHWLVNTQEGAERILVAIPLYHVYGMVLGMNLAVKMGASMILIPNPRDLDGLLAAAQKHQATVFPGVPNIYAAINRYPSVAAGEYDLSSIKACISGSATLPLRVKSEFEALTHGHLVEGYGLSEAPTATHCNPILGVNKPGSIGLPLPGVDCRIVDLETGTKDLPVGQAGELIIRGPQVMLGYHNRPEETSLALREGWLYTGDVATMDQEGYFFLVDRKKDVIKAGGFQVWPNEVEAVILEHAAVQEVAVAGVRDENGNEAPKAWIVRREGADVTPEEIQAHCRQHLTGYKVPRFVAFRDALPKTGVGKVLRRLLVEEHGAS